MTTILTRQERERLVLDLYNQGNTIREIAKEARMSFRDIGIILNKVVEEEKTEGSKQQEAEHLSLSTQSYKLFSEDKNPLGVAVALNLGEPEATKFYKEYWNLKQLHSLSMVYEDIKDDIALFLKLYKLAKDKGMGVRQIVNVLAIANNNDLPAIEEQFKRLRNDVSMLQFQKHTCKRDLYQLNNQITTTSRLLNSLRISCERERSEIENHYNEKERLDALVTEFKSNNEEYLKLKQAAEEKVKDVLTNNKILLRFATFSVIESLRSNPELCNFVIHDNPNNTIISYGPNYPLLISSGRQYQEQSFNYRYTALILEEAEKLYNKLTTELTNKVIAAAAEDIRAS